MTSIEPSVPWADAQRQAAFGIWLHGLAPTHGLLPHTLCVASADASFRRYLRVQTSGGESRIIMDAPPQQENCRSFVQVAALMHQAGLRVPQVLAWDESQGFMLLTDLGPHTVMDAISPEQPAAAHGYYMQAVDALLAWQLASQAGVLPVYDAPLLQRELALFTDWYVVEHRQIRLQERQAGIVQQAFETLVARCLSGPSVYVHRDFMPRNLMAGSAQPSPHTTAAQRLGVLDFQDAVYGPLTYDIASLMRDAFISWEEDFVIDITVRYWEKARKAGLMDFEDWHSDFGAFYRAVEWMGLQRHLKVAGIFARLSLRDGKPKYLADTPRFLQYIRRTAHRYRELGPLLQVIDHVEGIETASAYAIGRI